MIGVEIKNLKKLRARGYHFIESRSGDAMKIFSEEKIIYFIQMDGAGYLEVKDGDGETLYWCRSLEVSIRMAGTKDLCITQ